MRESQNRSFPSKKSCADKKSRETNTGWLTDNYRKLKDRARPARPRPHLAGARVGGKSDRSPGAPSQCIAAAVEETEIDIMCARAPWPQLDFYMRIPLCEGDRVIAFHVSKILESA